MEEIIQCIDERIRSHEKHLRGNIPKVNELNKGMKKSLYKTEIRIDELKRLKEAIKNLSISHNNDFKKDWRIQAVQKANSNKKINKKTLEGLKEYRQSLSKP